MLDGELWRICQVMVLRQWRGNDRFVVVVVILTTLVMRRCVNTRVMAAQLLCGHILRWTLLSASCSANRP